MYATTVTTDNCSLYMTNILILLKLSPRSTCANLLLTVDFTNFYHVEMNATTTTTTTGSTFPPCDYFEGTILLNFPNDFI